MGSEENPEGPDQKVQRFKYPNIEHPKIPLDFLLDPTDPGPGSTLFLLMENPADWNFGCSIFDYFGFLDSFILTPGFLL